MTLGTPPWRQHLPYQKQRPTRSPGGHPSSDTRPCLSASYPFCSDMIPRIRQYPAVPEAIASPDSAPLANASVQPTPPQPEPIATDTSAYRYCFAAEGHPVRKSNGSRRPSLAPNQVPIDVLHEASAASNDPLCLSVPSINPPGVNPILELKLDH